MAIEAWECAMKVMVVVATWVHVMASVMLGGQYVVLGLPVLPTLLRPRPARSNLGDDRFMQRRATAVFALPSRRLGRQVSLRPHPALILRDDSRAMNRAKPGPRRRQPGPRPLGASHRGPMVAVTCGRCVPRGGNE